MTFIHLEGDEATCTRYTSNVDIQTYIPMRTEEGEYLFGDAGEVLRVIRKYEIHGKHTKRITAVSIKNQKMLEKVLDEFERRL